MAAAKACDSADLKAAPANGTANILTTINDPTYVTIAPASAMIPRISEIMMQMTMMVAASKSAIGKLLTDYLIGNVMYSQFVQIMLGITCIFITG